MLQKNCLSLALIVATLLSTHVVAQEETLEKPVDPAMYQMGIVIGQDVLGIDSRGHLVRTSLTWGTKRDYGTFERELLPFVDYAKDKAYVVTANEVCEIDLASGEIARSFEHSVENGIVGVIDQQRVFVQNGTHLQVIDLESSQSIHLVELTEESRETHFGTYKMTHALHQDLAYVGIGNGREIAEVDLGSGQVIRKFNTISGSSVGMHLSGNQLVVCQLGVSYGIVHEDVTSIDLESAEVQRIPLPRTERREDRLISVLDRDYVGMAMTSCEDGGFCVASCNGLARFDKEGQMVAKAQPLQPGQTLIGTMRNAAVISTSQGFAVLKFSKLEEEAAEEDRK